MACTLPLYITVLTGGRAALFFGQGAQVGGADFSGGLGVNGLKKEKRRGFNTKTTMPVVFRRCFLCCFPMLGPTLDDRDFRPTTLPVAAARQRPRRQPSSILGPIGRNLHRVAVRRDAIHEASPTEFHAPTRR